MKKEEINIQLKKINQLLADDQMFNQYMEEIDNNKLETPNDLSSKIKEKINQQEKETKVIPKAHKVSYLDILKIAACTAFAVIMWQFSTAKPLSANVNVANTHKEEIYTHIDNVMQSINDFFMKPMEINKKGDQK